MGGGMRQVGILAAAGLHALDERLPLLFEDHEKAQFIAAVLTGRSWVATIAPVETNIVIVQLSSGQHSSEICSSLEGVGVRVLPFGPDKVRFVTHFDIRMEDLETLPSRLDQLER
jgi:threonine aldolase